MADSFAVIALTVKGKDSQLLQVIVKFQKLSVGLRAARKAESSKNGCKNILFHSCKDFNYFLKQEF
jgi:hypothetical protein